MNDKDTRALWAAEKNMNVDRFSSGWVAALEYREVQVQKLVRALQQCQKALVDVRAFTDTRLVEQVVNAEIKAGQALAAWKEQSK